MECEGNRKLGVMLCRGDVNVEVMGCKGMGIVGVMMWGYGNVKAIGVGVI